MNRVAFCMHTLLLDTTATNLEVTVEPESPERGFSFMNGTKTVSRNNLVSKQLNNLMVTGLHSRPSTRLPQSVPATKDWKLLGELDSTVVLGARR